MNPFERKSIFIWNVPSIEGGNPAKIVALLQAGGFESVFIKAAQGRYIFYPRFTALPLWLGKPNLSKELVDALHAAGIAVTGWGFCNGIDADGEGLIAAQQVAALGLDGWAWDAEGAFEAWTDAHDPTLGVGRAGKVLGTYKKNITRLVPTAVVTWAQWHDPMPGVNRPWHNKPMALFFMENTIYACDYGMPMCYENRQGADGKPVPSMPSDSTKLLASAVSQWREFTEKPLIPIGRAYTGDAGIVTAESLTAFDEAVGSYVGVEGVSWWSLDNAKNMPVIWAALARTPGFLPDDVPPVEPSAEPPIPADQAAIAAAVKAARLDEIDKQIQYLAVRRTEIEKL